MSHYRTPKSVKFYNWFKLAGTLILTCLFVFLLLRVRGEAATLPVAPPTTSATVQMLPGTKSASQAASQTPEPTTAATPTQSVPETEEPEVPLKAPVISAPKVDAEGMTTFAGTGTPGSLVEVWTDDKRVGQADVGEGGTWTFVVPLDPGDYNFAARAVDDSGTTLAESPAFKFVVPAPEQAPTLTTPQPGALIAGNMVTLAGAGTPGAEIEILDEGKVLSTTVVQPDGTWTHACFCDSGTRLLSVQNAGEPESVSESVTVQVALVPMSLPDDLVCDEDDENIPLGTDHGTVYVVAPCEYIGLIADRVGVDLADLLAVNPQVTDPDRIEPGQILNLPPR
ncbi:MAG: LysM peptidoglycan-binding domain-containing protein [Anaerolineae bacterium]